MATIRGVGSVGVFFAACLVIALTTPIAAEAYPSGHWVECGTFDTSVTFKFASGAPAGYTEEPWTSSMKDNVRSGIDAWDSVRKAGGSYAFSTTETTGTADWTVYSVKDLETNSSYGGWARCSDKSVILDFRKSSGSLVTTDSMKGLATHEFGHVFWLLHTGYKDSWYHDNEAPSMEAGCTPGQSSPIFTWPSHLNTLEDDDYASAMSLVSTAVNPNPSFEHGSAPGWKKDGGSWTAPTGDAGYGNRYLTHTGETDNVYNTVTLFDPPNGAVEKKYRAALRYREPSSQTGTIAVDVYRKFFTYPSLTFGDSCVGQFKNDYDLNAPYEGGNWVRETTMSFTRNPTTAWSSLQKSSWKSISDNGAHIQIKVTNLTLTNPPFSVDGTVHLDTVYIQECWSSSSC